MEPSSRTPHQPPPNTPPDLGAGDLTRDVIDHAKTLFRDELELARTEIKQEAREFTRDSVLLGGAGLLAFYSVTFMLIAIMYWIDLALPIGLSAFIVALIVALIAAPLGFVGWTRMKKANYEPERTVRTIKEGAQWAGQQLS
jgi:hypothetical protein